MHCMSNVLESYMLNRLIFHRRDAYTLDMLEIPQGAGSGLVWDMQGRIVSNFHVIRGASDLQVLLAPVADKSCCLYARCPVADKSCCLHARLCDELQLMAVLIGLYFMFGTVLFVLCRTVLSFACQLCFVRSAVPSLACCKLATYTHMSDL